MSNVKITAYDSATYGDKVQIPETVGGNDVVAVEVDAAWNVQQIHFPACVLNVTFSGNLSTLRRVVFANSDCSINAAGATFPAKMNFYAEKGGAVEGFTTATALF